jgi:hypothetical protein
VKGNYFSCLYNNKFGTYGKEKNVPMSKGSWEVDTEIFVVCVSLCCFHGFVELCYLHLSNTLRIGMGMEVLF